MSIFDKSVIKTDPKANREAIVEGKNFRITVLTSRLIRFEYSDNGIFEDRATRLAVCRNFPVPKFTVSDKEDELQIITEHLHIFYDKKPFSEKGLRIELVHKISATLRNGYGNVWHYGDEFETLDGTARTLDGYKGDEFTSDCRDGKCKKIDLGKSLMNPLGGFAVLDDSKTLAMNGDGTVTPLSDDGRTDFYFFDYRLDYKTCLKDFYRLSGKTPLLPRYALGNWWSRYYRYSEESYCRLLDKFEEKRVPFSVGVIDMDWHRTVDVPAEYGSGWLAFWTGYSWDKTIFPDSRRFLKYVHDKGLKTTLNLHPADGIRGFEDSYDKIADAMGVDKSKKEPVEFDITSYKFLDNYFKCVLNDLEDEGVDFWWIDWQQGTEDVKGYDILWMLNHYHFIDSARRGERPLTFSRYAGVGSHRYPIGFSGDSVVTWESLAFQPYFTNSASNVGYGWWSHDIGGHMGGYRSGDLTNRWLQLGVFSPINRLHASSSEFTSKEPWTYDIATELSMIKFLRLRHRLVPYLYTMNERAHSEGLPIVLPLYYEEPESEWMYRLFNRSEAQKGKAPCENQYYFGSELMVSPIVTPTDRNTHLGKVYTYFPEEIMIDFFNGRIYKGKGKFRDVYRAYDEMPVFAKAGAIVPMESDSEVGNKVDNPHKFEIRIFGGADGEFTMYEDNDKIESLLKAARTTFTFKNGENAEFVIKPVEGAADIIPEKRDYELCFFAISKPSRVSVNGKDADFSFDPVKNMTTVIVNGVKSTEGASVTVVNDGKLPENNIDDVAFDLVYKAEISFEKKEQIYWKITHLFKERLSEFESLLRVKDGKCDSLIDALLELALADKK